MTEDAPDCCRRSFAASVRDTAKRLLEDSTVAPRAVAAERITICEGCDRYTKKKTCEICQCYMPLKTTMANMACPIDKWKEWKLNS